MIGAGEPIAVLEGVSKRYSGVQALSGVDLQIRRGEVRALLGKNGAGKSTVIRMLAGAEAPDTGTVTLSGTVLERATVQGAHALGVRTVFQELTVIPDMTVAENLFMGSWPHGRAGIDRRRMLAGAEEALHRIGVDLDPRRPVGQLSIADQQMVEIARAVADDPGLLILDEPTSSLAAAEVERVLATVQTIRAAGVAVVYVSHRVSEIRRVADTATVMRDGRVIDTVDLAGTSNADVVQMMLGEAQASTFPVQASTSAGRVLVSVRDLAVEPKVHDVSFDVREGEVLGLAGVLGSGRTELLQVIAGLRKPDAGRVEVDGVRVDGRGLAAALRLGIGLTPEDRKNDGIIPDLGVDENLVITDWKPVAAGGVINGRRLAAAARRGIDSMSVKTHSPATPIGTLSGGNQQKVVIGRWLHAGSRVLLLDEPTRGVDVQAKAQIYALLRDLAAQGRAVVFVSSEMDEINLVCDRALVLAGGRIVAEHLAPHIETDKLLLAAIAEQDREEVR
ncbi:sugar ABC transporter ATP-binding protein [Streptomyces sp. NP160]|uniref:sugar ABC transporter ATP-binding protein n=1 Tax=Streptomyces sp. NP160 TaxID=2586637 RepID=UPI0011181152|nr:sugar ABC transporter ATP-binding protein [Streptomyces sp. NP160]TNM63163.1 sugar ABC transporter ATP-binding protein [Streptomyces sp. NP160]